MDNDLTHVTAVLDASGSMSQIKSGVVEGFNSFFDEQEQVDGRMTATLYEFSEQIGSFSQQSFSAADDLIDLDDELDTSNVRRRFQAVPVEEVTRLNKMNYQVGGATPLYDALAEAIDETGERLAALDEEERPSQVIVLALTDGKENASDATKQAVKERITHQQDVYDWEFMFIGAQQDAVLEAGKIGIDGQSSMTMSHSDQGSVQAMNATSRTVASLRAGESDTLKFEARDRQNQARMGASDHK